MKNIKLLVIAAIIIFSSVAYAETLTNFKDEIASDIITAITMDPSGSIWIGTNKGISRFNGLEWKNYWKGNAELPSEYINCIMPDFNGNIYFGTTSGVTMFDSPNWESLAIPLPSSDVESMIMDGIGDIWYGTGGGFAKSHNERVVSTYTQANSDIPDNFVKQVVIDSYEYFWLATGSGVSRFDNHNFVNYTTTNNLPDNYINSIAVEMKQDDDVIWIATPEGVGKRAGNLWSVIKQSENGLLDNDVKFVLVDNDNNKWFATDSGVSMLTSVNIWKKYTEEDGLVDNNCTTLGMDNSGNVWVGTMDGVTKIGDNPIVSFNKILYLNIDTLAYVTVTDSSKNLDESVMDTVSVTVSSDTDSAGIALTLRETGENNGVFSSNTEGEELGFSYEGSVPESRLLYVSKGDAIYAFYQITGTETIRTATAYYNEEAPFHDRLFVDCFIAEASYSKTQSSYFVLDILKGIRLLHK